MLGVLKYDTRDCTISFIYHVLQSISLGGRYKYFTLNNLGPDVNKNFSPVIAQTGNRV